MKPPNTLFISALTTCVLALAPACDVEPVDLDVDELGQTTFRDGGSGSGGGKWNTNEMYGTPVPYINAHGHFTGDRRLLGVAVDTGGGGYAPISLTTLRVVEGKIEGTSGVTLYEGADFLNSVWKFEIAGVERIATMTLVQSSLTAGLYNPSAPGILQLNQNRLVYELEYEENDIPIKSCADAGGFVGTKMILFGDLDVNESNGQFTSKNGRIFFGCLGAAVAKAALWGYGFDGPGDTLTMEDGELATAVVRSDLCRNGGSFTEEGNEVLLEDIWGINWHGTPGFRTEALWKEDGPVECASRTREPYITLDEPIECLDGTVIPLCEDSTEMAALWDTGNYPFWTKI